MAIVNKTLIQLKYSTANSAPTTLDVAEPAYSFVSDKMWIGDENNIPVAVGGQFYTGLLDANTQYATPGTLVIRDSSGSSKFNDVSANTLSSNTTVFAGLGSASPLAGATNPLIGAGGNANNYVQNYIRNINSGGSASADFVAYSDDGSDVSGWVDMGIASSTFNEDLFSVTGPGEGYLFMSATNGSGTSGNLVIATDSTGVYNDIVFQTGGFTGTPHPIAHFRNGQGLVIDATTSSSSNSTGALVVNGGVGIAGTLYVDNIVTPGGGTYVTSVTPSSGPGISISSLVSNGAASFTVNNSGVVSLTANTGDVTSNSTTGNIVFGLATTAVSPGTYGGSTQVPSFTVDSKGRVTFAGNNAISTSFTISGNTGTPDTVSGGNTLYVRGNGTGVTTAITDNTITIATDTTVLRSNTTTVGPQVILTDVSITGNLIVQGDQTISNTTIVQTQDSLIKLASNNVTDVLDIGFYGQYGSSGTKYAGLFRKAADKFYLFKDATTDPTSNVVTFTSANRATLDTNITGGSVSGLSQAIAIADGGTNSTSFSSGQILQFDGTSIVSLANTGTAGTYGNTSHVPVITTDALGRVSGVTNTAITLDTTAITSGTLPIARGGTNSTSYTDGQLIQFDGTGLVSIANTGTAGVYGNTTHVPVITTDALGRVSSVTNTAITLSASAITSGTLGVVNGGTGSSSYNIKGVIVSDSASTTGALTALTGSAYQVLQLNASGVPTFAGINGGTF